MTVGLAKAWGQDSFTLTTQAQHEAHSGETLYWMETKGATGFFAIPHTDDVRLSTSNMPNLRMLWYIMDAGEVSGTQYYYVVNKSTGKFMKLVGSLGSNNTIQLATFDSSNADLFKFSIGSNEGAWVLFPKNGGTSYWVNKQSGSVPYNGDNTKGWFKASNYNKTIDDDSRWYFRAYDAVTWAHPFTNSTIDGEKSYYFIQNKQNAKTNYTNYVISTHNDYASVSTEKNNNGIWYFVEAASDGTIPNLKYYYIVNAHTGKRMYFNSNTLTGAQLNSNANAVDIREYVSGENEDRYQFAILNAFGKNYTGAMAVAFMPKKLIGLYDNKYTALGASSMSNNSHIGTLRDRGTEQNTAHWGIETAEYPMRCTTPTITFDSTTGKVTITAEPAGSDIHYTTDGVTAPTASSGTSYSAPFSITEQTTIKAIASKDGYVASEVATATFYQVATPTIQNNGNNAISITCDTEGATIYYTTNGSNPTTSSTEYTGLLTENVSGKTIKAIAVKSGMVNSSIASGSITLQCAKPVFIRNGNSLTITCAFPSSGATIYYIKNGGEAAPNTAYSGAISVSTGDIIKAYASATGYENSVVVTKKIFDELTPTDGKYLITSQEDFENFIDMASTEDGADKHYILQTNVTAGSEIPQTFTGIFDGGLHTISGAGHALFNSINGAIVKNVIFDEVGISGGANAGTIANIATGDSRIYNCGVLSGSISGSNRVGSIVGSLEGTSRVINCYSYADVRGGSDVGGIVGYNAYATTAADLRTMVMNCVFYGDIKSGSTISPVYGGENIDNLHGGLNTYNYYAYEQLKTTAISEGKYNCALGVEDIFLTRFEFYRQLLNSNRRLAAKYASKEGATVEAEDMAKWVLETADRSIAEPMPYPVLKAQAKYPSIINYDTRNLADYTEANQNKGLKTGTLAVTISESNTTAGGQTKPTDATVETTSLTLTRTDKDYDRYNFNYDKVQLPYYNDVGTKNYTGNRVVTGWKITSITASGEGAATQGSLVKADSWGGYNYADRKTYAKDIYSSNNPRVFAQGAYFDVPYGVTAITIEPYWGEAAYVADENYDVVYSTGYSEQGVTQLGQPFGANGVSVAINGSSQQVYSTIANAVSALTSGGTVYDHAVVLVGNVHLADNPPTGNTPFTIMAADLDFDNEPDCSFIFGHNDRQVISPVRFDFINIPGIAMAQKPNGAETFRNVSIFKPKGWFETTNTCVVRFVQFEYDNGGKSAAPLILQGGMVDQFVSTKVSEPKVTTYIHLGGNTWFKDFGNGTHSDGSNFTPHIPISVTGGDFDAFYLSGTYKPEATVKADNAECYISGGRFGEIAGAAQQQIDGNVQWQIYNADIDNFFGGGVNADKPVTGNITIDIFNSHVGTFCGGPKFGDMVASKEVTTRATGCTFDTYFGAGYGGISYNRHRTKDATGYDFSSWQGDYTSKKGKYIADNKGVATDFDYEFFVWSTGQTGARFYVKYASLSMAKTNNVSSTLTNCTINRNYYGGGNLGKVDGTATSVLDGCTVEGNIFGGGYSASKPKVPIRTGGFSTLPKIDTNAGVFDMGEMSGTEDYELVHGTLTDNSTAINTSAKTIITDVDLTGLGQVTTTSLTIRGNTIVRGKIFDQAGEVTETTGGVFGGGDMSAVNGNTLVDVQGTESTDGVLNVYGGGNTADVGGNAVVNVTSGKVSQDVYGGGKGQTTVVGGNVTVNIGAKTEGVLSGSATIAGSVYGGSALGAVNAKKENATTVYSGTAEAPKTTSVNIYGGSVAGSVYGGGLGQTSPSSIAAKNFGDVTVTMEGGTVSTAVYGGSNANGVLEQDATVTITGGTVGTVANPIANAVFGGGYGEPTLVGGNVTVNIGTSGQQAAGATINGHVYGGGALGNTNASGPSTFNTESSTALNLYKGTINGDAYGGGLGQKNGVNGASSDIESFVGGNVNVLLDGAKITGSVFGCNNLNGTPKGHVKVHVKRTVDSTKNPATARDSRTTYDVAAVYGGGNKADYVPTDATLTLDAEDEEYDAGNPAKVAAACAEVVIEGCDATSIQYVYGGGNAAAVPATDVSIKGTYIIDQVFGGGNGAGEGNPGANVGIYKLNSVDTNYGSGKAVTKLYAGKIHVVYGGSNTKGNVRGGTSVSMPQKPEDGDEPEFCDDLDVKEIYGAGQNAEQDGGVTMILGCITGLENVYGGAKDANVKGGVDLVVTSGHFNKVFGGNDTSGTIQGPITVTIEETGCDSVTINELYLGGNNAAYSVYGYKQVGDNLVARTSLSDGTAVNPPASNYSDTQLYRDPVMNIISCTRIGSVFGGGYGSDATMYGSPTVNINMIPGKFAKGIDRDKDGNADNDTTAIGAIGNVYGGGNAADVIGDTRINICTEATAAVRTNIGAEIPLANRIAKAVRPAYITGDVFGAGKGTADVEKAKVTGSTTIVMTDGTVKQSVYGGGELSQVTGNTNITVSGGTIGTTGQGGEVYGNIYGGGKGNTTYVKAGLILGNTNITMSGGSVLHNVYGGGAHGSVGTFTYDGSNAITGYTSGGVANITITGGTIGSNGHNNGMVFGSSRGDIDAENTIYDKVAWVYDTRVIIGTENAATGPTINGSLYGSGENGHTYHDASVTMYSGTVGNPNEYYAYRGNVYGGGCGTDMYWIDANGNGSKDSGEEHYNRNAGIVKGNATVTINGGSVANNIYGAGSMGKVLGSTSVTINTNDTIGVDGNHDDGNVYGAARGELGLANDFGSVTNSSVTLTKGTVKGSLYGGGKAGPVNGAVTVNLNGGAILHDVYGGGALAKTNTLYAVGEPYESYVTHVTLNGTVIGGDLYGGGHGDKAALGSGHSDVEADVYGPVTVTVNRGLATNVFGCNNINGAPQTTVTVDINGTNAPTFERELPIYNVYGGGNQAAYTYTDPAHPQNLQVNIAGGTIGNVYGGGLSADVAGGISVTVSGGTVKDDVYGGGALANTNTGNWNASTDTWSDTSTGTYYAEVKHLTAGTSTVDGYYTRTGSGTNQDPYVYSNEGVTGTASAGTAYYKKLDAFLNVAANGTTYKTNVELTGGVIGNAYGGGLGQKNGVNGATSDIAAMVYGDVAVTVDGAAFTDEVEYISGGTEFVAKHGRVFGCNNLNGTPKGKVTVTVNSTKRTDGTNSHVKGDFEIQAVYGGGNLANYVPQTYDTTTPGITEFGQKTRVIIDGCSNTSINKVYGGGNAANVPFTDVTINGAFEIGYVFGGGNGGDKIPQGNGWTTNPGANVSGYANVLLRGGTIGQAFGGSDTKGDVGGADVKQETSADCPLRIVNLYGAGNGDEANSDGDINIEVSACGEGSEIQNVFGGSYKANIKGSVTLTIKSGIFTSVYGGNDRMGSIGGNITVNIEETDDCSKPIIIQNLYGGCYQTAYPGEGAKTYKGGDKTLDSSYDPFPSGKITVNVKSATRIDRIYGGSENGAVTGDTEVNINMVRGSQSGHTGVALPSYYSDIAAASLPSNITVTGNNGYVEVHGLVTVANTDPTKTPSSVVGYYTRSGESEPYTYTAAIGLAQENTTYYKKAVIGNIAEGIGTIGEVFGGGNKGNVSGNATVNIVTEETVRMASLSNAERTVLGAKITGNVYGGGNLADVKGNTYVNICVKDNGSGVYEALSDGAEHVTIGGNVYGGGKGDDDTFECEKGMVGIVDTNDGTFAAADKGTHIRIGNGTIGNGTTGGNVYGGGEVGRVEYHSIVTIGLTPKAGVPSSAPEVLGNVFGGGQGVETHGYSALLRGNTTVTVQQHAKVRKSVYGGGEISTIGRFYVKDVNDAGYADKAKYSDVPTGMPYALRDGGKCTVSILDDVEIGPTVRMAMPTFDGNVFGAGKGILPRVFDYSADDDEHKPRRISTGNVKDYFANVEAYTRFIKTLALTGETYLTIGNNAFVKGSVYGGSQNGRVLSDTHVSIAGGQIGWGKNAEGRHPDGVWAAGYTPTTDLECTSWAYDKKDPAPYDRFAYTDNATYDYTLSNFSIIPVADRVSSSQGGKRIGKDGHTYYGNVFGGGSGKDPYAPGKWHRQAGSVGGDTYINITGGHILTSVYGGNELTDVGAYEGDGLTPISGGKCTINMTGGTVGVPRTLEQITLHPVTCYLFGAGKGDQRTFFNTWTNVISAEVNITGNARIYGSTFGGGEDGHIIGDAETNIGGSVTIGETTHTHSNVVIGTCGTSYVDGNVFGGGRGFSGDALTSGTVGGNTTLTINAGTILGSVYGGGRLASVGTYFTNPNDPLYGQFKEDEGGNTYGHVTMTINGGTIGNVDSTSIYSGNVFGGSMGRITRLSGAINPIWPELAQVKTTSVIISGATHITRNVYGGGEFGTLRENANITITGGTIDGSVYGGGYGSDNHTDTTTVDVHWGGGAAKYTYTPMQWAGCVGGNTIVNISGSTTVGQNVYGGGELASVGIINYQVDYDTPVINGAPNYLQLTKHDSHTADGKTFYDFGLSWPYKFTYIPCNPTGFIGGKTKVSITGTTTIGSFVYGAGKGQVAFNTIDSIAQQRYTEAFCANVRESEVIIGTSGGGVGTLTPTIGRSVYGGGEDGHVYEDASVTIHHGTISRSVFGGGKGDSKFKTNLWNTASPGVMKVTTDSVNSWTAGRVYGNTSVTMKGGKVGWFIYGGGNMGSVGKGNYAGGSDDYSTAGYGELPPKNEGNDGPLWSNTDFTNSGESTVTITGGKVGPETGTGADADGIPYGSIFGGSRGKAAMDVGKLSPRYRYVPDFFLGYVNKTAINIGGYISDNDTTISANAPTIYGSVYGGGQDGHVRNRTEVRIFKGDVHGQGEDSGRSGNVFGAGSGIGKYKDGANYYCNNSSGSVTCTTLVDVMGGSIAGSVYGGGALASVGPPQTGQGFNEFNNTTDEYPRANNKVHGSQSYNKVTIQGGSITGSVYGAGRGPATTFLTTAFTGVDTAKVTTPDKYNPTKFATSIWTEVNINPHPTDRSKDPVITGSVYGGGEMGQVKESTIVNLTGGSIAHDAYGGGKGTRGTDAIDTNAIAADIGGNTTVELNKNVATSTKGCSLERIFGCNNLNGTPRGHVKVHVYATQHKNTTKIIPDGGKYAKYENVTDKTISQYDTYLRGLAETYSVTPADYYNTIIAKETYNDLPGTTNEEKQKYLQRLKEEALDSLRGAISNKKYDVIAVYGGGNLAQYKPYGPAANNTEADYKATTETAEVIIDGCDQTSIRQVYGGGNAATVPATSLTVNAAYEIDEVFGGGNGKDNYQLGDDKWYKNPGANVGYYNYTHYDTGGSYGTGTQGSPYIAIENTNADTKEKRQVYYMYGSGIASTDILGGRIHSVYGGSNEKGNISTMALSVYETSTDCPVITDETYGAGKNAEIDGATNMSMECVAYTDKLYGAAKDADVNSDVTLTITNGHFGQIFGGNNTSGKIRGAITINIQELSCKPIVIDELYGGGYLAGYSIYGYNSDNTPRTKEQFDSAVETALSGVDENDEAAVTAALLNAGLSGYPKHDPRINIISASKIGTIYGGGYQAKMVGSPHINVNMEKGLVPAKYANDPLNATNFTVGSHTITGDGGSTFTYEVVSHPENGDATLAIGSIGNIYGGGNEADVVGNTYVEIGTGKWISSWDTNGNPIWESSTPARKAATITGNVFGGGKGKADNFECDKAMVGIVDKSIGSTSVIIANGSVGGSVYGGGEVGRVESNTEVMIGLESGTDTVVVRGDVFGAGQGVATHGYSGLVRGNSTVTIQGKAKVEGSVYGGGKMATVGRYNVNANGIPTSPKSGGVCTVTVRDSAEIGPNDMKMTAVGGPIDFGHVFGAGKGVIPEEYSYEDNDHKPKRMDSEGRWEYFSNDSSYLAFIETLGLASQTEVTIGGKAFVKGSVYGGAENGYVQTNTHVTVQDGCQIGNGHVQMDEDGTYLTEENQYSINRRYTDTEWSEGHLIKDGETNYQHSLPECASWTYGQAAAAADKYATHDPFYGTSGYDSKGGRTTADNGHTFYGNVFGGGSGYFPYAAGKWHWKAGNVGGNTVVNITGGHILTNVYGGNEMTSVEGKCTVNMSGGTIGVPRTLGQIIKHPVTCYLFGAGMGDTRVFFNKQTNVQDVEVNITGGWVYGSVFGGGEDGHVLRDVTMNISSPAFEGTPTYADYYAGRATKIGTWGTSYVDGNIFGGGRGFGGDAYTAGNVAGSVTMTINSGEILGSVYGGGRLGSVGYGLYDEGATGYGVMQDDNKLDDGTDGTSFFTKGRGHIDITINGGTIGNNYEYKYFTFNVDKTNKSLATIQSEKATAIAGFNTDTIPNTAFELDSVQISNTKTWKYTYRLSHTKGGNVFAGGMGRMTQLNDTPISIVDWWKLGNVKTTKLTINGGTIKSNVYGGGELGMVVGTHTSADSKDVSTEINISDGTIGTEIKDGSKVTQYTFGSVFGGGYGSLTEKLDHTESINPTYAETKYTYPKYIAGRVKGSTEVTMTGGAVKASVYGGGDMAAVGESKVLNTDESLTILGETLTGENGKARDGNTYVTISGGTIGIDSIHVSPTDSIYFGGATMGNVYGGGNGYINTVRSGQIYGSTNVTISQAEGKTTRIYHNIYGGGAYGTVGDFTYVISEEGGNKKVTNMGALHTDRTKTGTATVTITGGTIGVDGHENGMIFGSSRGEVDEPGKRPDWLAWTDSTHVTIGTVGQGYLAPQPQIKGSIYGSGENGHTYRNTSVNIHSGTIGNPTEYYAYRGNVYGGGCGTDTYTKNGEERYNPTAGIVRGNTSVVIDGGLITGSVYGAGAMASVGTVNNDTTLVENKHTDETSSFALSWPYKFEFADSTGTTTVNISGGHIGINGTYGGDVYGSARGKAGDRYVMAHHAYVRNTVVNVSYPETAPMAGLDDVSVGCITGSVHGSGEDGYVYGDSHVTLNKGLIGHSMYGAGKGQGTYTQRLLKIGADKGSTNPADSITTEIEGLISGKVMGNTYVTMNDGHVVRNIYGGGNLGSVGKGNYAGGADDYSTNGYGEKASGNLWDNESEDSKAFLSSGKATVKVLGGTVGYVDETDPSKSFKNNLPYGNVFGSSTGVAAPNVPNDLTPRYLYCPTFFSGYVNDTEVTIGKTRTDFVSDEAYESYLENDAPKILASVYGGGQDGHVRRDAKVIINSGVIGMAFDETNRAIFNTTGKSINEELDDPQWQYRGNVFGAGSGISKYEYHFNDDDDYADTVTIGGRSYIENDYSTSAGSVTRFTEVDVKGGTIHRNVYGGGSLACVGAPKIPVNGVMPPDPYRKGDTIHGEGKQSMCSVTIGGGPQLVMIGTPTEYQAHYGGEVYGASRGQADADPSKFGSVIWTLVKVMDGTTIQGNVFGGGDAGMVKKDAEVIIGEERIVTNENEDESGE